MKYYSVEYQPGTVKSPQATELQTALFTDTNRVHFPDSVLRTIPEWSDVTPDDDIITFQGIPRSIFAATLTGSFFGSYYLFGTNERLYAIKNSTLYNITPLASASVALAADPITTSNGSSQVTIAYTAHGLAQGDRIKLTGATDVGGITAATYINVEHIVNSVTNANSFTITLGAAASSGATGGGASVEIYKQIDPGNESGGAQVGFGSGLFGDGLFGQGVATAGEQSYPRIWSFDSFGNEIVMCPGDYYAGDGQLIYIWDGDTETAPTQLSNSPEDCNWVCVVNNSVVALCGRTVKISELGNGTVWSGVTYTEKSLERVWKLISGRRVGDKVALLYTPNEVIYLRYTGTDGALWDLSDLISSDGLLAPNAVAVIEETAYWPGRRGFYTFNGSSVSRLRNAQNEDWIFANLNYAEQWKSFAMPDPQHNQAWFFFPMGDDVEPGDYVIHNYQNPSWTLGELNRTAAQLPGFVNGVYYMANSSGADAEGEVYRHFVSNGDLDLGWYAETSYAYVDDGDSQFRLMSYMPDNVQDGDITLTVKTKRYMQGAENASTPYTITSSTERVSTRAAGRVRKLRFEGQKAATLGLWKEGIQFMGRN